MRADHVAAAMCLTALFALACASQETEQAELEQIKWAVSLMHRAVVIDAHCDTAMLMRRGYDISVRHNENHIDIPRMLESGLDCQFFACFFYPNEELDSEFVRIAFQMLDSIIQAAERDERFVVVTGADELLAARREGRAACILALEGGHMIGNDLAVLRNYARIGVRAITLTWNNSNRWADSSHPDQEPYGSHGPHGGLTEFGRQVVREMNRLGIIVDVSHVHDDTLADVLEVTTRPVIASHSSCYALNPHYRNLKDEQLRAIAANGGVVGINYFPGFISAEYWTEASKLFQEGNEAQNRLREQFADDPERLREEVDTLWADVFSRMPPLPDHELLMDHFDHAIKVAGIDHVGLGSDFDGIREATDKLNDITDLFWIVVGLRQRGYSEEDIRKVLGLNFLRVLRENAGH